MHSSTLCPALFGFVFLGAVRAAAWAPPKDKSEHYSEASNIVVVSEDEASLLQAGTTNLHPKIDHGHYATAKDRHDGYHADDNYDSNYYGKNYDHSDSTSKVSHDDHYQSNKYDAGDDSKHTYDDCDRKNTHPHYDSEMDDYAFTKKRSDTYYDNYGELKHDSDHSGMTGYSTPAKGPRTMFDDYHTEHKHNNDYYSNPHENWDSKEKVENHGAYYGETLAGNGRYGNDHSDKAHDESYAKKKNDKYDKYYGKGKEQMENDGAYYGEKLAGNARYGNDHSHKAHDESYVEEREDKHYTYYGKGTYDDGHSAKKHDYTYAKEGEGEYESYALLQVASLKQAADYVHSKTQGDGIHARSKDAYNDHYRKDEYDGSGYGKVGDYTYAKKHTTAKYDGYSGQHKEERYAHARQTYKYHEVSGKHKEDNAAYAKGKTDHRDDSFRKGKARDYAVAKQKKTKYGDYPEQGKSGNYPEKNTKYNDYSGQGQADINGLLKGIFKGLSKGDSYVKKDIKYDDHSRQDQADVKRLLNGIFTRLSKDDDAPAQQKTTKYRGNAGKRKADDSIDAAKHLADKFEKRKKTVLGRKSKYWNLHKGGLWKGVFRGHSKEDMTQHHHHSGKRMEASKGHAKTTAGNDEADDYRRADKHGDRQIAGSGVTKTYLLSHKRDRHHRFINGRWLRGRFGHWRYLADAKEKATKQDYSGKLKESSYAYAKQSKKNLGSYSGIGKDSKGKHDDYTGIGMADNYVDANTLTTEHGDYSGKGKERWSID